MLNTRFELLVVLLLASPLHWHYSFALQIVSTGRSPRRQLKAAPVDVSNSLVYGAGLSNVTAGAETQFYIQLRDSSSVNVTAPSDSMLSVTCVSDPSAGSTASFCAARPAMQPAGGGLYIITYTAGTIWGAMMNRTWPPPTSSTPLSDSFFQGNNYISVTYNNSHLPGSPFKPNILAEPVVAAFYSHVDQIAPVTFQASTRYQPIGQIVTLSDRFTNWIRQSFILQNLTAVVSRMPNSWQYAAPQSLTNSTTLLSWFRLNWYINIYMSTAMAGSYNWYMPTTADFTVRPAPVALDTFTITTGTIIVGSAGVCSNATLLAHDAFRNAAVLVRSYDYTKTPFYSIVDQEMSLMQVYWAPTNGSCPRCLPLSIITNLNETRMGAVDVCIIGFTATQYNITFSYNGSPTLNQPLQIRIEPGPVSCNDTYVIRLPSVIEAGSNNETVMVQLRDIYSNNIICQVDMLTVKVTSQQSGWSLTLHAVRHSQGYCNSIMQYLYVAGNYTITISLPNGQVGGASYPLQVIASSQPSAYHSVAVGSGLGSHYNPGLSFMPLPANATQAVAYVLAGVNYSVTVTGYDNWNNRQQVSKPGFVLNQGFISACSSYTSSEPGDGTTSFYYTITKSGYYNLEISLRLQMGTVDKRLIVVLPSQIDLSMSNATSDNKTVQAGENVVFWLTLKDRYSNIITDLTLIPNMKIAVEAQQGGVTGQVSSIEMDAATSSYRVTSSLFFAGNYRVSYFVRGFQIPIVSSVLVTAAAMVPAKCYVSGYMTTTSSKMLLLVSKDNYNNTVPNIHFSSHITNISIVPSCRCTVEVQDQEDGTAVLQFRSQDAGSFQLYIMIDNSPIGTYPYVVTATHELVSPPAAQNASSQMCNATVADCGGHGLLKAYQCLCDAGWSSNYSVDAEYVVLCSIQLSSVDISSSQVIASQNTGKLAGMIVGVGVGSAMLAAGVYYATIRGRASMLSKSKSKEPSSHYLTHNSLYEPTGACQRSPASSVMSWPRFNQPSLRLSTTSSINRQPYHDHQQVTMAPHRSVRGKSQMLYMQGPKPGLHIA
eukprot:jgi/Chrzof1/5225/Cz15g17120.t1